MTATPTIATALATVRGRLTSATDTAALDAQLLLSMALDKPREFLLAWPETTLSDAEQELSLIHI